MTFNYIDYLFGLIILVCLKYIQIKPKKPYFIMNSQFKKSIEL